MSVLERLLHLHDLEVKWMKNPNPIFKQAADEIERLREAINQMLDSGCSAMACLIGTSALQQKESE